MAVLLCPNCFEHYHPHESSCPHCQYSFPTQIPTEGDSATIYGVPMMDFLSKGPPQGPSTRMPSKPPSLQDSNPPWVGQPPFEQPQQPAKSPVPKTLWQRIWQWFFN